MTFGRAIDHLVIASHSLDRLAARYEGLGFNLTPLAHHEDRMGTSNRLAQFADKNFLELLEVDRPDTIADPGSGGFAFGAFLKHFLGIREGLAMIVFQTEDARADIAKWREKGLDTYDPFDFERQATLPDGSQVTVSFSLGFVTSKDMPDLGFFVCQNRAPDHFWKPDFQRHDNNAHSISGVYLCAPDAAKAATFLGSLFDGAIVENSVGHAVQFGPQRIVVGTQGSFADKGWPGEPPVGGVGFSITTSQGQRQSTQPTDAGNAFIDWI